MSLRILVRAALAGAFFLAASPSHVSAQNIGTFSWKLLPYCNVITVTVTQVGSLYRLEGWDDQCGGNRASAIGTANFNSGDEVGLGFNIVGSPGGLPLHVDATLSIAGGFNGTWRDSAGRSGTFVFGAPGGGAARPAAGLGIGSSCPPGQVLTGLGRDGAAQCVAAAGSTFTLGPSFTTSTQNNQTVLSLAFAGSGTANTAARSDHSHEILGSNPLAQNTAIGVGALQNIDPTQGVQNTAIGANALFSNVTGDGNTGIGPGSLDKNTGSGNTAIGVFTPNNKVVGDRNVAIGWRSGDNLTSGQDNVYIGYNVQAGTTTESGTMRIGTASQTATYLAGVRTFAGGTDVVTIDANGRLGIATPSSLRFKTDVQPLGDVQATVQGLRPVSFFYKPEYDGGSHTLQYGLVAEEVAASAPELVLRDEQGQPRGVKYQFLPTLLLSEVQRLEHERKAQADEIRQLRDELDALKALLRTPTTQKQ
jgi:trimeric autotransporter adhesin